MDSRSYSLYDMSILLNSIGTVKGMELGRVNR